MNFHAPQPREAAPVTPDAVVEVRDADLSSEVRPLIANVHAQIKEVTGRYGVASIAELHEKLGTGSRKELFAARKDVEHLSRLAEKLEYLWKEHKQVERALAMRKEAQEIEELERRHCGRAFMPTGEVLAEFAEASVYTNSLTDEQVRDLASILSSSLASGVVVANLFCALGKVGKRDVAEMLVSRAPQHGIQLEAQYLAGKGGDDMQAQMDGLRAAITMDGSLGAMKQLVAIAAAERQAGLDNQYTLSLIDEEQLQSQDQRDDMRDNIAVEHARCGREAEARKYIDGARRREQILFEAAKYSLVHGDVKHAEDIAREVMEDRGSVDARKIHELLLPHWVREGAWGGIHRFFKNSSEVALILGVEDPLLAEAYCKHEMSELRFPESLQAAMTIVRARNGERDRPVRSCAMLLDHIEKWRGGFHDPLRPLNWVNHTTILPLSDYMVAMDALGEDTAEIMRAIKDAAENTDATLVNEVQSIRRVAKHGDTVGAIRLMKYLFKDVVYLENDIRDQLNRDISAGAAKESLRLAKKSYEILQKAGV